MVPGSPKAIRKSLRSNWLLAGPLTERHVTWCSQHSLAGLAPAGTLISDVTLTGTCAQADKLLIPHEEAIGPGCAKPCLS